MPEKYVCVYRMVQERPHLTKERRTLAPTYRVYARTSLYEMEVTYIKSHLKVCNMQTHLEVCNMQTYLEFVFLLVGGGIRLLITQCSPLICTKNKLLL